MRIKCRHILPLVFFVLQTKNNFAQQSIDSVQQIDTVSIIENRVDYKTIQGSFPIINIPDVAEIHSTCDIGAVLQQFTSVQINSYGLGNASSISIRGANDDHTNVFWNGLKINSLSLGGTDVSLIPFESGDHISVETNNSFIGGSVNINSKPDWKNTIDFKVRSDFSSFDNYRNTLFLKAGNNKIQFHTSGFYQTAQNNFTYVDVYKFNNPIDTANHNHLKSFGTVNTLFFQLKKQVFITIGSWFQKKDKEIPSIMGANEISGKFQMDKSVRHYINIDKTISKGEMHFSVAHSYDELLYTDKHLPSDTFLLINSSYKTNRISNTFLFQHTFKHNLSLESGYFYNINMANVKEYVKKVTDHVGEVYSRLKWDNKVFNAGIQLTQPFSSFKYVRPQFFANAGFKTKNPSKQYCIGISYSDKYRFPDLNDRYWNPGGNPKLKPEFGWALNLNNGIEVQKQQHWFSSNIQLHYSEIKNNIVWTPITNSIWSPKNLKSARLYGIESNATYSYHKSDEFYVYLNVIYNFNRAQIIKDENNADLQGHFLRYKPQQTFKANFYIEQKYAGLGLNYIYTSTRFTDEENFDFFALKPYHLLDAYLTFKGNIKQQHQLQFIFKINNITNTSYESIRSYAQPRRYYSMSFIYHFSKLKK